MIAQAPDQTKRSSSKRPLTGRETQVLDLLINGSTYKEVSEHLGVGVETIRSHVKNICRKMEAKTKTHAVAKYCLAGRLTYCTLSFNVR